MLMLMSMLMLMLMMVWRAQGVLLQGFGELHSFYVRIDGKCYNTKEIHPLTSCHTICTQKEETFGG